MEMIIGGVLQFGKHKGHSIERTLSEDPSYLLWLKENTTNASIKQVLSEISIPIQMPFGKHKGIEIRHIALEYPDYINWLCENDSFIKKYKTVFDEVKKYRS